MLGFSGTPPIVRLLTRAWHISLIALAFVLPFELKTPWLDLRGALVFTNVELAALVALALWLVRRLVVKQRPRWRALGTIVLPLAALLTALLLASAFAPSDNLNALKVTARWCAGIAVCWMTVEAVHAGLSGQRLTCVVVVSGIIVALVAAIEYHWADNATVSAALNAFRVDTDFRVGGELRPSATLAYPTITAMVLEFALVFAAGWLSRVAQAWARRRWLRSVALAAALLLVGTALAPSTGTRMSNSTAINPNNA